MIADADRSTATAAAERAGVTPETIKRWRRDLETDAEFAAIYAELVAKLDAEWRAPMLKTMRAALDRMNELIPTCPPDDLRTLLDIVRETGGIIVQAEALVRPPPGKDTRGPASDRAGAPPAAGASAPRPIPVH